MKFKKQVIALESRIKKCGNVRTLGVKPNFVDYSRDDQKRLLESEKIYYPSTHYASLFHTLGKDIFPSYNTYSYVQDKIKQTALFNISGIPHPRTHVYYGPKQHHAILNDFTFPFIGKIPRGSSRGQGVFFIENDEQLKNYLSLNRVAYIQEYLKSGRDIRVVVIGEQVRHAYHRISTQDDFRSNVSKGGTISLENVPEKAISLAMTVAKKFNWNDFGIDILFNKGKYFVLEANMKYGTEGFKAAGIDYIKQMETLIENGDI